MLMFNKKDNMLNTMLSLLLCGHGAYHGKYVIYKHRNIFN